jgi:hypothetical protein
MGPVRGYDVSQLVVMIVNPSELCATDFNLREVIPLEVEVAECADRTRHTYDVVLKKIHDMGTRRYVFSMDNDNEFRSHCD